ncbi:TPA: hypothetical protein I8287_004961, partial [Kluyvera intermedia]|nr:hypothetical protein [Kluyvera intermedia]
RMAAQTPYPGYAAKRPIGSLSPGGTVAPVSIAPPGILPDGGADALSGLRGELPERSPLP